MMENDEQKLESIKALFDILLADAEAKVAIETVAKENGIVLPPKLKNDTIRFWIGLLDTARKYRYSRITVESTIVRLDLVDQYNELCFGRPIIEPLHMEL